MCFSSSSTHISSSTIRRRAGDHFRPSIERAKRFSARHRRSRRHSIVCEGADGSRPVRALTFFRPRISFSAKETCDPFSVYGVVVQPLCRGERAGNPLISAEKFEVQSVAAPASGTTYPADTILSVPNG